MGGLAMSPYGGVPRLVRGWAVGATAATLALAGHVIAGGSAPTARTLVAITAFAALPCAWMSSLEWTVRRLTGVMLVAQAGLHLVFTASSHHHAANGSPLPMLTWHVVATVVSVALLRHAETSLSTLVDTLALRRQRRVLASLPPIVAGVRPVAIAALATRPRQAIAGALAARAPPLTP